MSNLLPQILRNRGLDVSDDADDDALYNLVMQQDANKKDEITREFARHIVARDGSNKDVPDEYGGYKSPLHVLSYQASERERRWSDMDLVLNNLPPQMAKDVLMSQDRKTKRIPLYFAAVNAPRSTIDRMLALAPKTVHLKSMIGRFPLHHAANESNVDAIEPFMKAYPDALLKKDDNGNTPMDIAISKGPDDEFLKNMLIVAVKLSCSDTFHNYGELLENTLYKQSINPINLILIEADHGKRTPKDVVEFINQLLHNPAVLGALLHHAKKSDTEPSPADLAVLARRVDFQTRDSRTRVINAFSDDNREGFALHNATAGLGDSPKGPDRLRRRPLAQAVAKVLKTIEGPETSIACSLYAGWGSGKTQLTKMLVDEMMQNDVDETMQNNHDLTKEKFTPFLNFIWVCYLVDKYVYDMCCSCRRRSSELLESNDDSDDEENQTSPLLRLEEERIESSSSEVEEVIGSDQRGEEEEHTNIMRAIVIAICIFFFYPLILLAALIWRCFKRPLPSHKQGSEDYERASLVLFTLFKSHPSECLPFMVNVLSIILLFIPRFLFSTYEWCSRFLYSNYEWYVADYKTPSIYRFQDTTYIDVIFNGWEYSGSDELWASFVHNLYKEVEKKFCRGQINEFNLAYQKIAEKRVSHDDITRELNKKFKWDVFFMILRLISFVIVVLFVWMTHSFIQQLSKNLFVEIIAIILPIISVVQFVIDTYDKRKVNLEANINGASKKRNYEAGTGYMGYIKKDVQRLMAFLRYWNARLIIVIDDLDRCEEKYVVEILQAVILLLNDCPVTCFLAIDSRIVINILDAYMDKFCPKGNISGREYLEKIIQLPINIGDIDEDTKQQYIEFSAEGMSLVVEKLMKRIIYMKNKKVFGDNLTDWETEVEGVEDSTTLKLHSAVTYLHRNNKLKLSGSIPSVHELTKDKEQLDSFLLSVSRSLNDVVNACYIISNADGENGVQPPVSSNISDPADPVTGIVPEPADSSMGHVTFDRSEYERIYSPILNHSELNVFKQLSFIFPENPRSIKRILNTYSLARTYRSYKYDTDVFDILSIKMIKFIMLLERWPYATSLMIEVITRLNYECNYMYKELEKRQNNPSCDKKELYIRISNRVRVNAAEDNTELNLNELELYRLYDALEQELLCHNVGALRYILSRDHDIRLFKTCLLHGINEEVLMVRDIEELVPYAFNLNLMLLDHARKVIDEIMVQTPLNIHVREDMI